MSQQARIGLLAFGIVGALFLAAGVTATALFLVNRPADAAAREVKPAGQPVPGEAKSARSPTSYQDADQLIADIRRNVDPSLRVIDSRFDRDFLISYQVAVGKVAFLLYEFDNADAANNAKDRLTNGWACGRFCFAFCISSDEESANLVVSYLSPGRRITGLGKTHSEQLHDIAHAEEAKHKKPKR